MQDTLVTQDLFKRVLLKISGEALMGDQGFGLNPPTVERIAREVKSVHDLGVEICMVIGGGNIFRGLQGSAQGMERTTADYMGMLATVMNGIALRDALERAGVKTRVMSAISMSGVVEHYDRRLAIELLSNGFVVIFTAGTGNPFFTTDSAGCLRAIETQADVMLKATRVDGVYSDDPEKFPDATFYSSLSYDEAILKNLKVMDATALTLARDHQLPLKVFNLNHPDALKKIACGAEIGTLIS